MHIQGKPRSQIVLIESSLEEKIELNNPVRIIDTLQRLPLSETYVHPWLE
ncbi:MAG: hypothetical protein NT175_02905 [Bacteroidetes bacterium]|nr:hypothetical protein [Bacteroidota bacterium]